MPVSIAFDQNILEFEIDPDRLVASWAGPQGISGPQLADRVRESLANPLEFPLMERAVVPGDRVVLAVDGDLPERATILTPIVNRLESSGIERGQILVLVVGPEGEAAGTDFPAGVVVRRHDPSDREALAYLATTKAGRRVYLDREAVEADFLVPIGRVAADPRLGTWGPWGTLFPGLGDAESRVAVPGATDVLEEAAEVGWLLGNLFQVAVIPGTRGVSDVLAGASEAVLTTARDRVRDLWTLRVDRRPEAAIVGVGAGGTVESAWRALATGAGLVRRGGKVIAMTTATGAIGRAVSRLAGSDRPGPSLLKGAECEMDYPEARGLVEALDWADLYLLSDLDPDAVEDLGVVPLAKPSEALRLARASADVALISDAEFTRVEVVEDP